MKHLNVKISSRIIGYSASKLLIRKRFDRRNQLRLILLIVTFLLRHAKLGVQSQKTGGCSCTHCSNVHVEPPLLAAAKDAAAQTMLMSI